MGSLKLQSFEDYANASKIVATAKLEGEQKAARDIAANEFKTLLSDFKVTSIKELKEEDRKSFFSKLSSSEISESIAIIEEGTRSQIGKIKKNGKISSVYMHYDGYPDHMLPIIKKGYADGKAVDTLLKKGGGSGLEVKIDDIKFYGDKTTTTGDIKNVTQFVKDAANNGAEFIYLYSEKDSKWYMVDVYDSYDLDPAFESTIINEAFKPSKGNLRDAKKVAKFLEGFFMNHPALAGPEVLLGACKYMLAEALTDANFHSYREPVSKALKGRLSTIMVDIDSLGGTTIPIGKKTIINILETQTSGLANAAGWSGIGIVEGMAMFLDGFGHSGIAQKIVDAFELIWANESVMNEGNAFLAARAKAIEEDAEEFEFNGKNFPVINNAVEVEESTVTEAKFVKDFDKEVLDAEYKADITTHYPSAQFFVGKHSHFFGQLEPNLFFKAYYAKYYKEDTGKKIDGEFKITSIYSEKGSKYVNLYVESANTVEAPKVNEAEVKSDEDFKEYAFAVLQKAFGDDFDEAKAQEVVDGLLSKHGEEYGAAIGALTSSLG